jgi:superfamily II DNA or RNA helicase
MPIVNLIPINETYIKIETEDGPMKDLHEYFTIKIDNGHFFKGKKKWNGQLRLLDFRSKFIYKGLIPYIKDFCKEKGFDLNTNNLDVQNEISYFETKKFCEKLNLDIGEGNEIYEHQINAITRALRYKKISILSPTSSGKSLIIYVIVRSILEFTKKKILIIVPRTNLIMQLYGDFAEYSQKNKWSTMMNCHQIYSGQEKTSDKPVYISTWQSLQKMPPEFFQQFGCIIGDEMHEYEAKSAKYIISSCINAKYKIGLSGTLKDTKCHIMVLQGLFGPIYRPTTTKKEMDAGRMSNLEVKCVLLKHNITEKFDYRNEIDYLIGSEKRNKFIVNLAMSLEKNTCIFYWYVDKHGELLKKALVEANKDNKKKIYFISGKVKTDVREAIRRITDKEKDNVIIVASYSTFSTGANIKNLHNIIFASPTKAKIKIFQSIGRQLRLHFSKICAYLYDIADDLNGSNFTLDHFKKRVAMYNYEQFDYKIYPIELKE